MTRILPILCVGFFPDNPTLPLTGAAHFTSFPLLAVRCAYLEVPNSPRVIELWEFHPRSETCNPHCPVHWKHLRYPIEPSVESRVLKLVSVHL
ncbi:hypothetical protein TNCV_2601971 [Trichonephila clavipes]|nr:hypothetical protein TNCV_2601971 [Trichonephila clavipes]